MHTIVEKRMLAPNVGWMEVEARQIAKKRQPGQFVIVRIDETGERIPLTIADADPEKGTIVLICQSVGKTSTHLNRLQAGDTIHDMAGPLGNPSHLENFGTAVCIGGGVGIAVAYPIAKALKELDNRVISILGARNRDLLILEDEMRAVSDDVRITTDDGSYGVKGFVTDQLQQIIDEEQVDFVLAIGPTIMMKVVSNVTRPYKIPTMVSLNSIMIDGTGMCGGCRVNVGGSTKFVCVDGPEFDGHLVDFDGLMRRQRMYLDEEQHSLTHYEETCKLDAQMRNQG
ncbi:sulfide/dihydroorotate dehydrogenase-like FAD/NAD-binding protein [candidate division KSB3 bacterium]|uniref:Sulfide/dihydroorotate dehydrogenase-like FAD/NAD-binding protein n=1 Tax=candidate division KSB3 bacterium TaxID=2044937 RepID=A0A9D5JYW9_9BACT|nr:sulfide/dihydroorotate dehydrogenase-like FAD/NAD-binding protein [candidate division KSB3 bacterium]MBD3326570.1 sulfide/dihydroorotate dehydrogenase-like FAD/NAD-binding protein [candidate division KSB3 bacterium]